MNIDRETARELRINSLWKAYTEGKTLQWRNSYDVWVDIETLNVYDLVYSDSNSCRYRIKPDDAMSPKPFTYEEYIENEHPYT